MQRWVLLIFVSAVFISVISAIVCMAWLYGTAWLYGLESIDW